MIAIGLAFTHDGGHNRCIGDTQPVRPLNHQYGIDDRLIGDTQVASAEGGVLGVGATGNEFAQ